MLDHVISSVSVIMNLTVLHRAAIQIALNIFIAELCTPVDFDSALSHRPTLTSIKKTFNLT